MVNSAVTVVQCYGIMLVLMQGRWSWITFSVIDLPAIIERRRGMVRYYDPKDAADLARVEAALKKGGIEYFLRREPEAGIGPMQVFVAEEDLPMAEELLPG